MRVFLGKKIGRPPKTAFLQKRFNVFMYEVKLLLVFLDEILIFEVKKLERPPKTASLQKRFNVFPIAC